MGICYFLYIDHSGTCGPAWCGAHPPPPRVKNPWEDHLKFDNQCHFQYDTTKRLSISEVIHNIITIIIVYNQCSIYFGTKFSISNFECPPFGFFTAAGAPHYYTYMSALYRALRHSCRSMRL